MYGTWNAWKIECFLALLLWDFLWRKSTCLWFCCRIIFSSSIEKKNTFNRIHFSLSSPVEILLNAAQIILTWWLHKAINKVNTCQMLNKRWIRVYINRPIANELHGFMIGEVENEAMNASNMYLCYSDCSFSLKYSRPTHLANMSMKVRPFKYIEKLRTMSDTHWVQVTEICIIYSLKGNYKATFYRQLCSILKHYLAGNEDKHFQDFVLS